MTSERKEQAIYDAVSEAVMTLRIAIARSAPGQRDDNLDVQIAQAGHAAGMAAIAAYRKPLKRVRERGHDR